MSNLLRETVTEPVIRAVELPRVAVLLKAVVPTREVVELPKAVELLKEAVPTRKVAELPGAVKWASRHSPFGGYT